MNAAPALSRRTRLTLGALALLLGGGIAFRILVGGPGVPADSDDGPPPAPQATLAKGPNGQPALQLAQGQARALDLQTAPAAQATLADAVPIHGVVLDPLPFLDLDARRQAAEASLQAARAAETAARAELARVRALHATDQGASDKALQAAQATASEAAARRLAAEGEARKAQAAWAQNGLRDTTGLANFRRVLVRLDLPLGMAAPTPMPRTLAATAPGASGPLALQVVGLAPGGSPLTGGLALLALAPGAGLRPGLPVDATLAGSPAARVQVPRTALLWSGGQAQVFVAVGPRRYQPRNVTVAFSGARTATLASGLAKHEPVVVQGALNLQGEYARVVEGSAIGAGGV
jgi:hypothetical protein